MSDVLKTELAAGHPITGAYSADPTEAAEQINARNIASQRPLTAGELRTWGAAGPRASIEDASKDPTSPVRSIAITAIDLLNAQAELDLATHGGMLASLVAAGVITQSEADLLTAMAATTISRAEQLGLTVRAGTIERARA